MSREHPAPLWRRPDFRRFWAAQAVSLAGDHLSGLALGLVAVVTLGASAGQLGLLAAVGGAPTLLLGLFAGVWTDRLRRRPTLIAADLGRAALAGAVALAALLGRLELPHLYAVAALTGALAVAFNTAQGAFLPTLLPREQLVEGNARLTQTRAALQIAGPGLAGAVVQILSAPVAILLDAASFLLSALCLGAIRTPEPPPAPRRARRGVRREIGEGLRLVGGQPLLRASAASAGTYNFCNAALGALSLLYLARDLNLAPAAIGSIAAAAGPGGLLGAGLATRAAARWGLGPTLIGGLALAGAANLALPLAGGPPALVVPTLVAARFLGGLGQPFYNVNQVSLRQAVTPDRLLGRVNATMSFVAGATGPLGALLGGALGEALGPRPALLAAALGTLLAPLWPLCSPLRTLREPPAPAEVAP